MPNGLLEKNAADASDAPSEAPVNEPSSKISKPAKKTQSLKSRKQQLARKRQTAFFQRQKAKGLFRKYAWIKLPKDKLRKFANWISSQDPDALCSLVERGSPNDLKCLWDHRKEFEACTPNDVLLSKLKTKKIDITPE